MRIFALLFAGLAAARSLTRSKLSTVMKGPNQDLCGQGFESLNPGSQAYFNTISNTLWTHPGNKDGFPVFQDELKCWFARMLGDSCGNLPSNKERKTELYAKCTDPKADHLDLWNHYFSEAEFAWFKQTFPSVVDFNGDPDWSNFSQAMNTMKVLNTKEVLCTTLFVIDDGCVDYKYVKKN